jgi:hypothetical protein
MNNIDTVAGYALPGVFTVTGGGTYCAGGAGVHIGLSGSATGISYQLFIGSLPVSTLIGTGGTLDFGALTAAGLYTVVATNLSTSCVNNMTGSATISINPLPTVYSVTGGGNYCSGGTGVHVGLSSSQSGYSYQLYNSGTPGATLTGTGAALDFGLITATGTYTIVGTSTTSCTVNMSGSTIVGINPPPGVFSLTSTGSLSYCIGGTPPHIGLSGSASGISYQLYNGVVAYGSAVTSTTGGSIDFGPITSSGTYTAIATNLTTGCTISMSLSITVTVNPLPAVYTVTGGGSACAGGSVAIGLSGSQTSTTYYLYSGATLYASSTPGSTSGFSFGTFTTAGTYTVTATSGTCSSSMTGSAAITINPLPTLYTVTGGGGYCAGGSGSLVGLSGSQSGVNYQLLIGGSAIGSPVAGTGSSISFGLQSTSGTYTVQATNTGTLCTATMTGTAAVSINALPTAYAVTVSGGGAYCSGGAGDSVGVANSQSGVSYQLFLGGTPSGSAVTGVTGSPVSFGTRTTPGAYTVTATNITTGCANTMTGSITITVTGLPTVYYMTGGGEFCAGGSGVSVGLSGSQTGVNYQLFTSGTPGATVGGTGSPITFGLTTTPGTYTVVATSGSTSCSNNMSGTAIVAVNSLPAAYTVTGGGSYCAGGTGVDVALGGSSSGISYQLSVGGVATGGAISGTGAALDFGLQTTSGTYTVTATNIYTGCTATMTGSVSVSITSLPTAFTVTGGGTICAGSSVAVGLSGSQYGLTYQLYNGYTLVATAVGTNFAISFGSYSTSGTYTVVATGGGSCLSSMTGSVTITVNPQPIAYNVTGGGSFCSGGTGVSVGLDGSDPGVNYQLYVGGVLVPGALVSGTGYAISFGLQTTGGSYTVIGTNVTTACSNTMTGSVTVTVSALPTLFPVTGGGAYCSGGTGVHVGLGGSTYGVSYQLYYGSTIEIGPLTGTGSSLDFGLFSGSGTYTVVATDPSTGCVSTMSGSATITINPLPGLYTLTGGGAFCSGGTGYPVGLSGSATGVTYQLYRGGVSVGTALSGTGGTLSFGTFTTAGTYTVVATITATGCTRTMSGSATITVNPLPTLYTVTGGGSYCPGGSGFHVGLSGSASGIHYQLYRSTTPVGAYMTGTGGTLDFGLQSVAGTYTVIATNPATLCSTTMTGSAVITINTVPASYTVTGGGSYCSGSGGSLVGLSNSDGSVSYQLYVGGVATGSAMTGTGTSISFGAQTATGTYTVVATNTSTGCTATMSGSVIVSISSLPTTYTVTGGGVSCSGGTYFHVGLSSSQAGITYVLSKGGTSVATLTGTGVALDFGTFSALGTYTVTGTNPSTSCTSNMTGSAVIGLAGGITAFTVTGGGTYCAGGTGFHIYLSGSATGINYQLYRGTTAVGSAMSGTGASLDFGAQTVAGGYNVIATNPSTSCTLSMTGSASIAVNTLPTAYTVTGGGSYCSGGFGLHVGLSSSDAGYQYQLYLGTTPVGSYLTGTGGALDFGTVTSAGTYTVIATNIYTTCTNTMTGSATITILTVPSAGTISGPTTVHTGATITLTSTVSGGVWTSASGHVSIGSSSGIATGVSAGGTTIHYTVTNTCGSAIANYTVSEVGAKSTPAGTTEICVGAAESLPAPAAGGIWSSDNNDVATVDAQSGMVTGVAVGTTHISYLETDITGASSATITPVIVVPAPDAVILKADPGTTIASGQKLSITAAVNNNSPVVAYTWSVNNVVVPGANTKTYTSSAFADNDVVNCSIVGQCNSTVLSSSVKISITSETVQPLSATSDIRVVPNPNNGTFTIQGTTGGTADEVVRVELTDVLGQVMYKGDATAKGGVLNERILLGSSVTNGMYLLNVNTAKQQLVFHVVVEQ